MGRAIGGEDGKKGDVTPEIPLHSACKQASEARALKSFKFE